MWQASEPKLHGQFSNDEHKSEDNANHDQETDIQRANSNLDEEEADWPEEEADWPEEEADWPEEEVDWPEEEDDKIIYTGVLE